MQKWSTEFLEKIVMSKKGARVFVVGVIMSLVAGCSDSVSYTHLTLPTTPYV